MQHSPHSNQSSSTTVSMSEDHEISETTIRLSVVAFVSIIVNTSFTFFALVFLFSDVPVYWSSFTQYFRQEILHKNGFHEPLSINDVIMLSQSSSPHYDLVLREHRRMNIEFGTTWHNWCWNEPLPEEGWPSIIRSIEFHSISQVLLRCTFLWSILIRPLMTHYRSMSILDRISQSIISPTSPGSIASCSSLLHRIPSSPSIPHSILLHSSSPLHFLVIFTGFLCTAWQQNLDFLGVMLAPFHTHALFFLLHSFVYTAIELLDSKGVNWIRFTIRCILISLFASTVISVLINISKFLEKKTCHVLISSSEALCEYFCLSSIVLFSLLEWSDIWNLHFVSEDSMTWKGYSHPNSHN